MRGFIWAGILKPATQGKAVNIAPKSFDFAALPRNGDTPKISVGS